VHARMNGCQERNWWLLEASVLKYVTQLGMPDMISASARRCIHSVMRYCEEDSSDECNE